jgi:hypothetical protein
LLPPFADTTGLPTRIVETAYYSRVLAGVGACRIGAGAHAAGDHRMDGEDELALIGVCERVFNRGYAGPLREPAVLNAASISRVEHRISLIRIDPWLAGASVVEVAWAVVPMTMATAASQSSTLMAIALFAGTNQ